METPRMLDHKQESEKPESRGAWSITAGGRGLRNALLVVTWLALLGCSTAEAQPPSITLGDAVLKLGMSEAEVKAELAKHPPMTLDDNGMISNKSALGDTPTAEDYNTRFRLYGEISFKRGRLSHIEKHWRLTNSPNTDVVIASALYGAVSAMTGTTPKFCKVYTWTNSEPDQDYKETAIDCDAPGVSRSVNVFIKTFRLSGKEFPSVQVSEVLEIPLRMQ